MIKHAVTEEGLRHSTWCIWAALLAGTPFVLRTSEHVALGAAYVAPMQYGVLALAAAFAVLVTIRSLQDPRVEKRLGQVLSKVGPVVAVLGTLTAAACELGYLPMRLGNLALLDYQPLFDVTSGIAQAISLVCWALYGAYCVADDALESAPLSRQALAGLLVASILLPTFARCLAALPIWPLTMQFVTCLAMTALFWLFSRRLCNRGLSKDQFILLGIVFTGGLFCAAAFREGTADYLFNFAPLPPDEQGVTALRYAQCLAGLLASVGIAAWRCKTPKRRPTEACPLDRLESLPHAQELSPQQSQAISLVLTGMTRKNIAQAMGISEGTASTHLSRGLRRLGFDSEKGLREAIGAQNEATEDNPQKPSACGTGAGLSIAALLVVVIVAKPDFLLALPLTSWLGALLCLWGVARLIRDSEDAPQKEGGQADAVLCRLCIALVGTLAAVNWSESLPIANLLPCFLATFALTVWSLSSSGRERPTGSPQERARRFLRNASEALLHDTVLLPMFGIGVGLYAPVHFYLLLDSQLCLVSLFAQLCLAFSLLSRRPQAASTAPSDEAALARLSSCGLGESEAQVALHIAKGYTTRQIAQKLSLSEGTVSGYRATAYRKLGVRRKEELTRQILQSRR